MSDNCKGSDQILQLSANCRVLFFIVEKSVVMVYNKLLNFAGVTGDPVMRDVLARETV